MQKIDSEDLRKVSRKLEEFMQYCQKLLAQDTYLIVNRNSSTLVKAAQNAAENCRLNVKKFDLVANKPYKSFPKKLTKLLRQETPKAGIGLFDYHQNPDWNLRSWGKNRTSAPDHRTGAHKLGSFTSHNVRHGDKWTTTV